MKKSILLFCVFLSSILRSQQQDKFIIGAEHVSSMSEFWGCQLPHDPTFWNYVEEFGLNYVGLKYFQYYSPGVGTIPKSQILDELDVAYSRNLKVFLFNGFDHYEGDPQISPKRWLYQVEEIGTDNVDFLSINTGNSNNNPNDPDALIHWDLSPPPPGQNLPKYLRLIPGVHSYGLVASDLREKNLQPDGPFYYLKLRMRLPVASSFPATPVLTIKVKKAGTSNPLTKVIKANELEPHNNWQVVDVMCFRKLASGPETCDPFQEVEVYEYPDSIGTNQIPNYVLKDGVESTDYDIEIYWESTGFTVDLDYVAVDDRNADKLFAGVWNDRIDDFVNSYKGKDAVLNFQAHDEVRIPDLFPVRYINQRMQDSVNDQIPLSYHYFANLPDKPTPVTKRYIWETDMQTLMSDIYPVFLSGTIYPGEPGYTEYIQTQFQNHLIKLNYYGLDGGLKYLIENAKQFSKPFLFTVQAHKWDRDPDQHYVREPSAYEIKAMTNLAVCYGAKGISYYLYSHPSNDPTVLGFYYTDTGLPRDTDDYGYPKWETIKQLNQKLASIGNELLSLDWEGAKSWSNGNTAGNWIGIISNISTNVPSETGYVETSHSKIQDVDYIFVVNRRTLPTDQRTITVTIDKASSIYNNWNITEIGASNSLTVGKTGSFEFSYEPGEGKLFKLEPVVIAGGNLIYNEIISSDIELHGDLTIESGVTLTVNADYNCYGNITIKDGGYIKTTGNGKMFFNNHKRIIVEGTAVIIGEPLNKLELDFIAPHHTNGINVKNGGELAIYYSFIKNSRNGITVDPGGTLIEVAEVDFEDCSDHCITIAGPNSSNCWIHYNTFTNSNCAISATNLGDIYIAYNTVQGVEQGIYLSNVTSPLIMNNTISSTQKQLPGIFLESCSGGIRENTISGFTNGIHLGNSSPDIGGNEIINNLYHGIYIGVGSMPKMDARLAGSPPNYYPIAGYNDIWENGGTTAGGPPDNDGSEIFFNSSNAEIREGCNSIYDNRSGGEHPYRNTKLLMNGISFGGQITIHAEFNYWSDNPLYPLEERFGNLNVYYEPFWEEPCEIPVGGGGGEELFVKSSSGEIIDTLYPLQRTVGSLSNTDLLYAIAEEKFISADYDGAEVIYNQITNGNDSLKVKLPAYTRLYNIGKLSSKPESYFNNLNNVYTSLIQSTNDSLQIDILNQLSNLSLVGEEEYIQAIKEFDDVVQQNLGSEKAVYAEIDALTTSLLIEGEDSTLQKGRLGKYLIKNPSDYSSRIDGILRKHFGNGEQKTEEETIPTEYTLYQNYPNPFNPLTTIKYDLPNASNISLIIYDILGRKVKELVNTKQQVGRYEIQFNASNLASGVYVYQLIADKYISSKKMILLK